MPRQKDLKRRVRARMQKTGESYTAARTQLLRKKLPPRRDLAKLAGFSDARIEEKTARNWAEWLRVLDAAGMRERPHRDIARYVHERFDIDGWWAQAVTVGYERIHGLRAIGQRRDGSYEANKSRTFSVPVNVLYGAFASTGRRRQWLDDEVTVRKATPHKTVRMSWPDGTTVEAYFVDKGERKSSVAIQHRKLASKAAADACKARWTSRLQALAESLAAK